MVLLWRYSGDVEASIVTVGLYLHPATAISVGTGCRSRLATGGDPTTSGRP
jgi:hypothetical protein